MVGKLGLLCLYVFWSFESHRFLDQRGYIPHTARVDMHMKGGWQVGEQRNCWGFHGSPYPHNGTYRRSPVPLTQNWRNNRKHSL